MYIPKKKPKEKLNNYVIDKFLFHGGMNSEIYFVHPENDPTNSLIAKIVYWSDEYSDDFWTKFSDESITMQRVYSLDNLIQTFDVFTEEKSKNLVFIMEYIDGYSLHQYISMNGKIQPNIALNIFGEILNGIRQLHGFKHQIIHRDLKPENIMLSKDMGVVKIIDFGISSVIEKTNLFLNEFSYKTLTNEKAFYGTYPYICPDILNFGSTNKKDIAEKITVQFDFFSLGVILYEMLIGEKPFHSLDYSKSEVLRLPQVYDMVNISAIDPAIPVALENLIFKCIASKKEDTQFRYENVDEIIADVERIKKNWDKPSNDVLLKPIYKRVLQKTLVFNIDKQKIRQPFYKQWYFFCIVIVLLMFLALVLTILILLRSKGHQ